MEDIYTHGLIYPKFCVITGYAFCHPHPHRHYTFEEFIDRLNEDNNELHDFLDDLSKRPHKSFKKNFPPWDEDVIKKLMDNNSELFKNI